MRYNSLLWSILFNVNVCLKKWYAASFCDKRLLLHSTEFLITCYLPVQQPKFLNSRFRNKFNHFKYIPFPILPTSLCKHMIGSIIFIKPVLVVPSHKTLTMKSHIITFSFIFRAAKHILLGLVHIHFDSML